MIGKTVTFVRTIDREGQRETKNISYTGIILDKFRGHEKVEGKLFSVDYYLVELPNGRIGKFFPDEVVKIDVQVSQQLHPAT
jgi:hypothetical protein